MKRKKIMLSLLGILSVGFASMGEIKVSANAGADFGSGFSIYTTNYRPSEGYLNAGNWVKNPFDASNYFGSSAYYYRNKTHVRNKKYSLYGQDFYYYEPTGYTSAQYEAVAENQYAHMTKQSYYKENSYIRVFNNSENRNYSKWEGAVNYYDYYSWNNQVAGSNYYTHATAYDPMVGKNGQWRFIGYSMAGGCVENPFFPPDGLSASKHGSVSNANIVWLGMHGRVSGPSGAVVPSKYKVLKTRFDEPNFYVKKMKAIEKMIARDSNFNTGKLRYFTSTSGMPSSLRQWVNGGAVSAQVWAECLSLKTHPNLDTPVFQGFLPAGNGEVSYSSFFAPAPIELDADMEVSSIKAYNSSGSLIAQFSRDGGSQVYQAITPGNNYRFEYTVKNTGKNVLNISPAKLDTGFSVNSFANQNGQSNKFPENQSQYNSTLSSKESYRLNPRETATFTRNVKAPSDIRTAWKSTAYINSIHEKNQDNAFPDNDWGFIRFNKVALGDIGVENVYYVDIHGNRVSKLKAGEKYKVGFKFKYRGPDLDNPQDVYFSSNVTRFLPQEGGARETKNYKLVQNGVYLYDGRTFTLETEYLTFEQPEVDVSAYISISDQVINSNTTNDYYENSLRSYCDYGVSNVIVIPMNDRPIKDGNITVGIKYDIALDAPDDGAEYDTTTHITLPNGKIISVVDHVKPGMNKDIVHEIQLPVDKITSGSKDMPIRVKVNADKKSWESDLSTQFNNSGKGNFTVLPPINPTNFENGTGCPIGTSNTNNWDLNHRIQQIYGTKETYNRFNGSKTYEFYKYQTRANSNSNIRYEESYKIDNILFKSKFTTDNKYGTNGWVDLTKTFEKDKAKIKAGYGYELEINVTYKNNVFANQPKSTWNRSGNYSQGTIVSNIQTPANINNDIYVRTSDGKTLSATGMYGTIQAFDSQVVKNSNGEVKLKYTMKTKDNKGVKEPLKIFIDENAKDGAYSFNVFTPTMKGVGSTAYKKDLCDYAKVSYKVQGSMFDDGSDHIVQ